ncbi:hypothetical protein NDU88_004594 [Pleurodeles waltl]|uniref:Uncharacterized protein n=1 Tax=Pleurodeles waltl TaxID=8319 RepID=A0AAV7SJC8_PLEWA|nr:hypothetical protein NDU88_004594 [Pleurodeles waltl]
MRKGQDDRTRPTIACFLCHDQVQQLLTATPAHGPYDFEGRELWIAPGFSQDTNDKRRGFLALRTQLQQMDIKFGLFEPASMWITKNGTSKHFYDPQALHCFLNDLLQQPMDPSSNTAQPLHARKKHLPTHSPSGTDKALEGLRLKSGADMLTDIPDGTGI